MNRDESFYEQQKNNQWKTLIAPLKNNPEINSQLNNFITTFYWKFREKKGINKEIHPKVIFQGFDGFQDFPSETKMGHCEAKDLMKHWQTLNGQKVEGSEFWDGKILIVLNQKLLLDRLGMDKCFSSENSFLPVGFEELIATIAHELAHAHQYIINIEKEEPSQCESTGKRDANGNLLYPELANEHTQFASEVKSLIENSSEYQEFKKWWEAGKKETVNIQKCPECGKELYSRKTDTGISTNKVAYQDKEICVDCHHKLVREENQQKQGKKCVTCGKIQGQEDFYLATDRDTGRQLGYYCEPCKEKLEKENKCETCGTTENIFHIGGTSGEKGTYCQTCWDKKVEERQEKEKRQNLPSQPNPGRTNQEHNERKWGSDFGQLKPLQREGRIKTQNSWSSKKNISFVCLRCQKLFPYDKTMENYLEARQKAQNELNNHKKSCPFKESVKTELQKFWDKARKSKQRIIKTCEKCWGKVLWDKSIVEAETARQQALSDLKYHQKECGLEGKKKIAVYHSPNSGGNEHTPIDNFLTDDGVYLFDNEGEVYQEQTQVTKKNYWPWVVGGLVGLGIIGLIVFLVKRKTE